MSLTLSKMLPLNSMAPVFLLNDVTKGLQVSYDKVKGKKGTLVMFICNHCPYVIHLREKFVALAHQYLTLGVGVVAISSNDAVRYPQDDPEQMRSLAIDMGFRFPYLYDETQEVAKAYDAACTPDFYLFNAEKKLVYRGRLDDSRPGNGVPVTGSDLIFALENLIGNRSQSDIQLPSMGCNIKWR